MAIRAGSGGLKYRLPNRSQTQARQNAAAASAGGSASATAFSANRRYAGVKKRLRHEASQSAINRRFDAQQKYYDREHYAAKEISRQKAATALEKQRAASAKDRQQDALIVQESQAEIDREVTRRRNKVLDARAEEQIKAKEELRKAKEEQEQLKTDRDYQDQIATGERILSEEDKETLEDELDEFITEGLDNKTLVLTPEAKAKLEKLGREAYLESLMPEQLADFKRQQKTQKRRILRGAKKRPALTGAQNYTQNRIYLDRETGEPVGPGKGGIAGTVDPRTKAFTPTFPEVDQSKLDKSRAQEANEIMDSQVVGVGKGPRDRVQNYDVAVREQRRREKIRQQGGVGDTPEEAYQKKAIEYQKKAMGWGGGQAADTPEEAYQKKAMGTESDQTPAWQGPPSPLKFWASPTGSDQTPAWQGPPSPLGMPQGMPQGSKFVDDNTIEFPDGSQIRPVKDPR